MGTVLNSHDISFMENSVMECINQWNSSIDCVRPLPVDEQPNWNSIMLEYSGDISYTRFTIPAERKDLTNYYSDSIDPAKSAYGDRDDGTLMYAIPITIPSRDVNNNLILDDSGRMIMIAFRPHEDDLYIVNGDKYHVRIVKDRIGESLLVLYRLVGGTISGYEETIE